MVLSNFSYLTALCCHPTNHTQWIENRNLPLCKMKGNFALSILNNQTTVQSLYNTHSQVVASKIVHHGILQRNYRKMTINGHFPITLL